MIQIDCPQCQKRYRLDEALAGKTVQCRECSASFQVDSESAVVADLVEESVVDAEVVEAELVPSKNGSGGDMGLTNSRESTGSEPIQGTTPDLSYEISQRPDYAMLKLGIPAGNIKELVNQGASRVDISLAVKDWIARTAKQGKSDVYVFFAGHGLADQTGEEMYLLPADGEPRLLSDSSISRNELFSDIASANPRSVTVFLDTCYSGTTRGTDMLVASRPIAIRAKQQNIPDGFTVFTAAGGDQTAKPLEEAKHGMFSYFLMKGMEGDADSNRDNQITAEELHEYVEQNVVQQSGGSQVPELQGDAGRVLIRFQ